MKISIFGTGYVGLVTGTCLAELGHDVLCIDIDRAKIAKLKKSISPIYEPGLEELIKRNIKEKRLSFSTNSKDGIKFGKIVISAVGTPPDSDHRADLRFVKMIAKIFGQYIDQYKIFVNKSTVPVGTADLCEKIIRAEIKKRKKHIPFDIVSNPEFLREGTAIKDTLTPDRIVIGVKSKSAAKIMQELYNPIIRTGKPLLIVEIKSAEIIKYAANAFLATKISFINEISNFCEKAGGNIHEIAKGIGLDSRIGPRFLHAGIGYGGSCLPKDVRALIQSGKQYGYEFKIIKSAEEVNEKQQELLFEKLKKEIGDLKDKKIAIWGLSFKPKTDDIRGAASIKIIEKLLKSNAQVQAFDPVAMQNTKTLFPNIKYCKTPYDALKNTHALLILTEWDEFRGTNPKKIGKLMKNRLIIDGRNIFDRENLKSNKINYLSIGQHKSISI